MSVGASKMIETAWDGSRRWLLIFASSATVFGLLHHADHVIRGNHSGWPFQAEVTPFTFSLLIYALILPGIYRTVRGRDVAGYHLFVAVVGLTLLGTVHFAPTGEQESPIHDIYMVYETPVAGMLALVVLAGLMMSVALLGITAYGALRARTTEGD
ncbi:MAG TPA: hypothetical protein VFI90_19465 [Rubrobacter sp.]|nr:hypothetical protein [Rubrobacter sp.]